MQIDVEEALDRMVPRDVVHDRAYVVHAADRAHVLVVVVVLAELLEAGVEVPDVGADPDDALSVQNEDDAQRGVGGGMLRPEVEHPPVHRVRMVAQVIRGIDVDVETLVRLERVRHRPTSWCERS